MAHVSEWLTIVAIALIVVIAEAHMPAELSKDVALTALGGFFGYLTKTAVDAIRGKGDVSKTVDAPIVS